MPIALLYNVTSPEKLNAVDKCLSSLGIGRRTVEPEEFCCPVGYLAGREGYESAALTPDGVFTDEMLVLCDFPKLQFDLFLDMMKKEKVSIPLKAVLTETNAGWSSVKLHDQISAEHQAMTSAMKNRERVHRKKKR